MSEQPHDAQLEEIQHVADTLVKDFEHMIRMRCGETVTVTQLNGILHACANVSAHFLTGSSPAVMRSFIATLKAVHKEHEAKSTFVPVTRN